jgi:hypothetical protein
MALPRGAVSLSAWWRPPAPDARCGGPVRAAVAVVMVRCEAKGTAVATWPKPHGDGPSQHPRTVTSPRRHHWHRRAPMGDLCAYSESCRRFRVRLWLSASAGMTLDVPTTTRHLPKPRRLEHRCRPPATPTRSQCRTSPPDTYLLADALHRWLRHSASLVDLTRRILRSTTSSCSCLHLVDDLRSLQRRQCRVLDFLVWFELLLSYWGIVWFGFVLYLGLVFGTGLCLIELVWFEFASGLVTYLSVEERTDETKTRGWNFALIWTWTEIWIWFGS